MTESKKPELVSDNIDGIIRKVARQRTMTNRITALKENESVLLKRILFYTYNPYIKFGIALSKADVGKMVQGSTAGGLDIDDPDVWALLDDFKSSTASSASKKDQLANLTRRLNPVAVYIICGIISKDLISKVSVSTVNKVWPGLIPTFSVQLAHKYADKKVKSFPMYVEIKYDGIRAPALIFPSGEVEVMTRTGRSVPAAAYFHRELQSIGEAYKHLTAIWGEPYNGCITDGELCGETFSDSMSLFRSNAVAVTGSYFVFDILPMEALQPEFKCKPLQERKVILNAVFKASERYNGAPLTRVLKSNYYVVNSTEEIWAYYNQVRADKLEGLIVKDPKGLWQKKRTFDWMKIKAVESSDLRIIGAFEGEGEMEGTLGGLIVDHSGVSVRVGTGFSEVLRATIWAMFLRDLAKSSDPETKDYELIGNLAEIEYQEVTADGSLRHPVFTRLRLDKDEVSF